MTDRSYLILSALSQALQRQAERIAGKRPGEILLDVGCGQKPYFPLFEGLVDRYYGCDFQLEGAADFVCDAAEFAIASEAVDIVLSTQVLEHLPDPERAVAEMSRLLRPGGIALVSVPGTYAYHPAPSDYWRWTAEGLQCLFGRAGDFEQVEIVSLRGTAACLCFLTAYYTSVLFSKFLGCSGILRPVVLFGRRITLALINIIGIISDRLVPGFLSDPFTPHALISNYLVVARKSQRV